MKICEIYEVVIAICFFASIITQIIGVIVQDSNIVIVGFLTFLIFTCACAMFYGGRI